MKQVPSFQDPASGRAITEEQIRSWSPKRRDFLRVLGIGAGAAAGMGLVACGGANAQTAVEAQRAALMADEGFWADVQSRFMLNNSKLFMNIGTAGSMPRSVVERYNADNIAYATESMSGYSNWQAQRTAMAKGFGVDPDELVIDYNTSDGMSKAILGIPWQAGDVVITTNHEHPGGYVPLGIAVERYGVIVRRVTLPAGDGAVRLADGTTAQHNAELYRTLFRNEVLAARAAGQRVRALMWSSPTYLTGIMLPIPQIQSVAKEFGLISIVDGAHLPGMMAYNYADLGVDFMAGAGHKWQCGPGSSGILVMRNKARPNASATLPPYFPVVTSSATQQANFGTRPARMGGTGQVAWTARGEWDPGSVLSSIGSMHAPHINALANACADWDAIGRAKIQTYVLGLSLYTKEKIIEMWGSADALYSPRDANLLSALTSFNPFHGLDGTKNLVARSTAVNGSISASPSSNLVTRLQNERNIIVRNTTTPQILAGGTLQNIFPIRMSTHLWHDPNDIDRALAAIREIAMQIAAQAS
ncbi:MAG TPA: aminotransferase class V-fold PLP-dependent enzyme [Ramlibacter sp.]|jgi:selenocysteine lyase/cysteine desulfurase|nr:aminotransferase class V-fold PLP-dependent enzyme [Ramlibacter sp.]